MSFRNIELYTSSDCFDFSTTSLRLSQDCLPVCLVFAEQELSSSIESIGHNLNISIGVVLTGDTVLFELYFQVSTDGGHQCIKGASTTDNPGSQVTITQLSDTSI